MNISERDTLELITEVNAAIAKGGSLTDLLRACAESLVRHLDAAFARIWTLNESDQVLELQASAGLYTHLDGPHSRVPVGKHHIGRIAQQKKSHLTNQVVGDSHVSDQKWARRERLVSSAGCPLLVDDKLLGVMAVFAKHPFSDLDLQLMGVVADIVAVGIQRCRLENQLRSNEVLLGETMRRLNEAQQIAHLGHWEQDLATGNIVASDETYRIFGLTVQEDLRSWAEWEERLHPEDRAIRATAIALALQAGPQFEAEYRAIRPTGEIRIVRGQGEVERNEAGQPIRLFGIVQDVTEHRRAEQAHLAAEQRLQHVLASSPAILLNLELEGERIRRVNWISDNVREMLGYAPEEASAPSWFINNIHSEERDRVIGETLEQLFERGRGCNEYRFRRRDGRYVWNRVELRLVRDAAGRPVEAVGSCSDITERKRLEDQFRQSQKMEAIGQLAAGVAHDFNNLLTIISGYSDILLPALDPTDPKRELVSQIRQAGDRAAGLTRQLLAFSRKSVLEPKIIDLNEVVRENEKMLQRLIGEDLQLAAVLETALQPVRVDPSQIGQILMNLAVNARDAMPMGGKMNIQTSMVTLDETASAFGPEARAGRYVLLAVTDTGAGMTPEVQAHIFEPFFTTKGPGKGSGLGLATVYGIVKQSGGFITVYSEPGRGTTFKLYFPVATGRLATGKSFYGLKPPSRGTETILLVEDEDAVRSVVRIVLQQTGYSVLEARRGSDALRLAGEHAGPIHMLITDVVMPEMGGRELAQHMVKRRPGIKVLYLSGYTDDAIVRQGILQADFAFLQKPFSMMALTYKVREVLDAPNA